jgi:DNA-binding NarL/FixJ family response regulator
MPKLVVVDQEPSSAKRISALAKKAFSNGVSVETTSDLDEIVRRLRNNEHGEIESVLVKVNNDGLHPIRTVDKLVEISTRVPVVAYSDSKSPTLADAALQAGAQDFLVNDDSLNEYWFEKSIHYALERQHLKARVMAAEAERIHKEESERYGAFTKSNSPVASRMAGSRSLREMLPEGFEEFVQTYVGLLDEAVNARADTSQKRADSRSIAQGLAFLRAGPKDVVEIHGEALKRKGGYWTPVEAQAYVEEARLLVVEVMGHLVAEYRRRSQWGLNASLDERGEGESAS